MSNQELFQAMNMFKDGVRDLFTGRTIAAANEQVQEIKASELDEAKKRAALTGVSQQIAMQLAGLGAPATTIAQVVGATAPAAIRTPDQLIAEGTALNDPKLVQQGMAGNKALKADELGLAEEQRKFTAQQNALDRQYKLKTAEIEANKVKYKPIEGDELKRLTAHDLSYKTGNSLLETVKANPALVGIMNGTITGKARQKFAADYARFQADLGRFFDKYKVATTGAAASDEEMKRLVTRIGQESDTYETFKAKMEGYLNEGHEDRKTLLQNMEAAGRDVSRFKKDIQGATIPGNAPSKSKSGIPAGATPAKIKNKKTGLVVDGYIGADGKPYPLE